MREDEIQKNLVKWLKAKRVVFSVGLEGAKRHPAEQARLKAMGMQPGQPDISLYLPGGRTVFIELKTEKGRVSDNQRERHELLKNLGFDVHVLRARDGGAAIDLVEAIIQAAIHMGRRGNESQGNNLGI